MNLNQSNIVMALDTSGSFCSVALRRGDGTVLHRESDGAGDHFERLPSMVQGLLVEAGVVSSQLTEMRIGLGPGSFTGLRIGMSFAKGMATAARIPLRGVCSFAGVARSVVSQLGPTEPASIMVVSDARRSEVFCATYELKGASPLEVSAPRICPIEEVVSWREHCPTGFVVTPLRGPLPAGVKGAHVVSRIAEGLLAVEGLHQVSFDLKALAHLEPNYLRAVAAKSIAERTGA